MRSRCATASATSSLSPAAPCPPRPSQSPACHCHATPTAPQCRAASPPNHEHNAQRVLAHVLHALQPHADQVGCHELHLVVLFVIVAAPQNLVAGGVAVLQEAAKRSHFCGRPQFTERSWQPLTLSSSHISPLSPLAHAQWWCREEETPVAQRMQKNTSKSNATHFAPQDRAMRTANTQP
ncbi:hypothetical protein TcCL_ESM01871 [Trypanosoma cruzi]|nr:hypothetical protein TcCL_ESM01871 [Trypanosoma cruzi]